MGMELSEPLVSVLSGVIILTLGLDDLLLFLLFWLDSVPMAGRSCTELRLWGSQVAVKRDERKKRKEERNLLSFICSAWALTSGLEQEGFYTQTAALIKPPTHYHDSIYSNVAFTWPNPSQGHPSKTHTNLTPKSVDHTNRITRQLGLKWLDSSYHRVMIVLCWK